MLSISISSDNILFPSFLTMQRNNNTKLPNQGVTSRRRRSRNNTKTGSSAIQQMVRVGNNIANGAISAVKNRYLGPEGMSNMARDVGMLKMLVNTEEKQIFTLPSAQTVSNVSPLVYGIGTMAQGTASNQRVGDSVKITRIDLNLLFLYSSGTTTVSFSQTFNWYLLRYKKTPASSGTTAFGIAEFLNADGGSQYTPISFPNPDTADNFQLMAAGQVALDLPVQTTVSTTASKVVSLSHNCNFHQEYNGSANTTITDNMCFVVLTAISGANTGGASQVVIQSAMWYVDN